MSPPISTYRRGPYVIRAPLVLEPAGAYDPLPTPFDVRQLEQFTLLLLYTAAAVGGRVKMYAEGSADGQVWYKISAENMAITVTAEGFQTDVAPAIKRFPAAVGVAPELITYTMNGQFFKQIRCFFAEAGTPQTPGTLGVVVIGQWALEP